MKPIGLQPILKEPLFWLAVALIGFGIFGSLLTGCASVPMCTDEGGTLTEECADELEERP